MHGLEFGFGKREIEYQHQCTPRKFDNKNKDKQSLTNMKKVGHVDKDLIHIS